MTYRRKNARLAWQSKAVLLLVVPWVAMHVLLQSRFWITQEPLVACTTLGISGIFGLIVWRMRAGTPGAAATGAAITASLMYSTTRYPYQYSWLHGGLMPLLAVFVLTYAATKAGRTRKEVQGTAESKRGRNSAQVAANLGAAALFASLGSLFGSEDYGATVSMGAILSIAALAEAAADTVSSEIGQAFGGQPRMLTTLRRAEPGTDGAITLAGTACGIAAAVLVAAIGSWALGQGWLVCVFCSLGAILGLFFDSLLGATFERKGWLNNDAVNFLSTLSAAFFTLLTLAGWLLFMARGINED